MTCHRLSEPKNIGPLITVLGLLMLAACGGGGGGGGGLPATDNVLPAEVPDGSTAGIEDYLVPGSGTWRVNLDGQVQAIGYGSATLANALNYDPDLDQWTINVDGANFVLTNDGFDTYGTAGCTDECAVFQPFDDDPVTSQYGTFGYVYYEDTADIAEFFGHYGLKTVAANMPTGGTGDYAGTFWGLVNYTDADFGPFFDYLEGTVDITATFAPGGGNIAFASSGIGQLYLDAVYSLTGTATISGNTYQGTVTGSYDDGITSNFPSLALDAGGVGSSLSGAFYGPDADETAGVVYATSAAGDPNWGELAGGFWAEQPPPP